jgi:hypothetical protein
MFPESFVLRNVVAWSSPGDLVLDPFCGRGTTILESLLNNRRAIGCDTNPVAACISRAKSNPPKLSVLESRLAELEFQYPNCEVLVGYESDDFFESCYHPGTLKQVLFLRSALNWRKDKTDCFIAAVALGSLHGESHRTELCFSNRMPRTISTKPDYSVRWWKQHGCVAPKRDVFGILRAMIGYRFESSPSRLRGRVVEGDARDASKYFRRSRGKVRLLITSPPYIDITNYREDQWLRLWFLGGPPRPSSSHPNSDDRYRRTDAYWKFLTEAWSGVVPLLSPRCHVVVRIGGSRLSREDLAEGLLRSLKQASLDKVILRETHTTEIKGGQRRSFTSSRSLRLGIEHDFRFLVTA